MKNFLLLLCLLLQQTFSFSQGSYVEMKLSSTGKEGFSGNFKSYAQDGNVRMDMNMVVPQMPGGAMNFVTLVLKNTPGTLYMIDEKAKTYSELNTGTNEDYKDYEQSEYDVIVIGKEKVNGYNATHVKIKVKGSKHEQEMWTSTEVVNYAAIASAKTKYWGKNNLNKALAAKGAAGFPVRIVTNEGGRTIQMDLIKAETRNNPASLFSIVGYTKQSGIGIPGGPQIDIQQLIDQMKNATPEERDAMLKHIQELYGKQPH